MRRAVATASGTREGATSTPDKITHRRGTACAACVGRGVAPDEIGPSGADTRRTSNAFGAGAIVPIHAFCLTQPGLRPHEALLIPARRIARHAQRVSGPSARNGTKPREARRCSARDAAFVAKVITISAHPFASAGPVERPGHRRSARQTDRVRRIRAIGRIKPRTAPRPAARHTQ